MADETFMRLALSLARKGRTSPNPKVGCVIVKGGRIIGQGYHRGAGLPHAEIEALSDAKRRGNGVRNATMYLTLEPCSHEGKGKRTPPCAPVLASSGISHAVIAMRDPNPRVGGRGIAFLRKRGMEVRVGPLGEAARELNLPYIKWITKRVPYVAMKMAMSADGRIATRTGDSKWVSGGKSRALVHRMRSGFDAVMVGAGTARADDPRLTARIRNGHDPIRIIVDSDLCVSPKARFMRNARDVIIATAETAKKANNKKIKRFESLGARVIAAGRKRGKGAGDVDLKMLMRELGKLGICSVLLEGGSELNGSAIEAGIVDKIYFFIAPKIVGGCDAKGPIGGRGIGKMKNALMLKNVKMEKVGGDWLLSAEL